MAGQETIAAESLPLIPIKSSDDPSQYCSALPCKDVSMLKERSHPLFDGIRYENPWGSRNQRYPRDPDTDDSDEENIQFTGRVRVSFICQRLCGCSDNRVPERQVLENKLPVRRADFSRAGGPNLELTWIGHATSVLRMDNISLITDPIFSDYCAPVGIGNMKRLRKVPCRVDELPENLRLVLISHNHYDHLDFKTVLKLHKLYRDKGIVFCVPKGLGGWFRSNLSGLRPDEVIEFVWWEQAAFQLGPNGSHFRVVSVPAQHWSLRKPNNRNMSLWCGWVVIGSSGRKFYFAGDTGYCPAFQQIGAELGPIDLATIPVGAYKPRSFLRYQHINPREAVKIHKEIGAQHSVGVHWGTFRLGGEKTLDPRLDLPIAREKYGVAPDAFIVLEHGETKIF